MRTIRVTGKGQIKVTPDVMRITITLDGSHKDYAETLRMSSEDTDRLKDLLSDYGFERADLKTLNFSVDTEYESYKEKEVYKQRFIGYSYHHLLKVEFDFDNERLGRVLYALANSPIEPEFRVSYTVKDTEGPKNALLGEAVTDAKVKAEVLTRAAGIGLKQIQSIDYSWGQINFEVSPMDRMLLANECMLPKMAPCESCDLDIQPDDIELSDTVTVVWEIDEADDKGRLMPAEGLPELDESWGFD